MGDIAKALGHGSEITFDGKVYPLAPLTFEVQAAFEIWLEKRAWGVLKRAVTSLAAPEYARLRSDLAKDIAAGEYSFGSEASAKALQSPPGQKYLFYLLLKKAQTGTSPDVTELLVDKIYESDWQQAMAQVDASINDPNSPTPAVAGESPSPAFAPSSSDPHSAAASTRLVA